MEEGVCHLGSSDCERLSCPSLPQQGRQSRAGWPMLRQGQRKQANKTTLFKHACHSPRRDFHCRYLSSTQNRDSHRWQSLNTTLVFSLLREIRHFQPFSEEWEASADWGDQLASRCLILTGLSAVWHVIFGCAVAQHQEKSMASPQGQGGLWNRGAAQVSLKSFSFLGGCPLAQPPKASPSQQALTAWHIDSCRWMTTDLYKFQAL